MESLEDRILDYITKHDVGGLHDITVARDLDADSAEVVLALQELRDKERITARDRQMRTNDGVTTLDEIRIMEQPDDSS